MKAVNNDALGIALDAPVDNSKLIRAAPYTPRQFDILAE